MDQRCQILVPIVQWELIPSPRLLPCVTIVPSGDMVPWKDNLLWSRRVFCVPRVIIAPLEENLLCFIHVHHPPTEV